MTEAQVRKMPGMASVKDMPVLQDGPPPGGFAPVRYARRIPNKGPSAIAIFLAALGTFSYGMYQVGQGNKIRRWSYALLLNLLILGIKGCDDCYKDWDFLGSWFFKLVYIHVVLLIFIDVFYL